MYSCVLFRMFSPCWRGADGAERHLMVIPGRTSPGFLWCENTNIHELCRWARPCPGGISGHKMTQEGTVCTVADGPPLCFLRFHTRSSLPNYMVTNWMASTSDYAYLPPLKTGKHMLPFHLPVNSWTNNPTKWPGVPHLHQHTVLSALHVNLHRFSSISGFRSG